MINDYNLYINDINKAYKHIVNAQELQDSSILITGATGLIGSVIAHMLLEAKKNRRMNIQIFLSSRDIEKLNELFKYWHNEFIPVLYDLNDDFKFDFYVDYIIHCAGNAHPNVYATYPINTLVSTINGCKNLLVYAKENKIKRFLYVSSSEVYGIKDNEKLFKENDYGYVDILNPRACYPMAKQVCETLCSSFKQEHNINYVVVRPGHIYGPTMTDEDSRASAQFIKKVAEGKNIQMKSAGEQLRSYCHCIDCATAVLTVLTSGVSGNAYNISNEDSIVTIRQFAEMCAKITNKKIEYEIPNEREKRGYNMMPCSALDSDKLYELGWTGIYNLEEGISETLNVIIGVDDDRIK